MSSKVPPPEAGKSQVVRRKETFAKKITTKTWQETPCAHNPYIAESSRCHGYDLTELMAKRSYADTLFLLFRGELPSPDEAGLFEKLLIAFINPGPRHPATRAAMNAGVGNTDPCHILPIGLTILGGEHLGAGELEPAIRWLRKHVRRVPQDLADELMAQHTESPGADRHLAPGFGSYYGGVDEMTASIAAALLALPGAGPVMQWAKDFSDCLNKHNMGWLNTGLAAAALADLGFHPKAGGGVFQILSAPGLLAHGLEMANKPLTAMPFPDDSDYHIGDRDR